MRIAVIGAGAVGSLYGAVLCRAGADVQLFGRGSHLRAVRDRGLRIESEEWGGFNVRPKTTDDPARVISAAVVLVTVPRHQLESCAPAILRAVASGGAVVPFQNGVDARDCLVEMTGGRVCYGTTIVQCEVATPGIVRHRNKKHSITIGGTDARGVAETLRDLGLTVTATGDGLRAIWQMAAFRIPLTAACCAYRTSVGGLRDRPEVWKQVMMAAAEVAALSGGVNAASLEFSLGRAPRSMVPSAARDVRDGVPVGDTELPYLINPLRLLGPCPVLFGLFERAVAGNDIRGGGTDLFGNPS